MRYDEYKYLFPPRPEKKIPPGLLSWYERRGWLAQVKKNGTCTVVFARGLEVLFKKRHFDDDHLAWTPPREVVRFFQSDSDEWNVFVCELVHSKTPGVKNQIYLFDQIVLDGEHLVGASLRDRYEILLGRWESVEDGDAYRVNENVSVAKSFYTELSRLYRDVESRESAEDEGLVLKDPAARLSSCVREGSNSRWQVKCRFGSKSKNYGF